MDLILKGILNSHHPETFKGQLIKKKLIPAASQPITPEGCHMIFATSWDFSVNGDSEFTQDISMKVFKAWAYYNKKTLAEFLVPQNLLTYLMDNNTKNKARLIKLIHYSLELLQETEKFTSLCHVVQTQSINCLLENSELSVLVAFTELFSYVSQCVPIGDLTSELCIAIIHCLSNIPIPEQSNEMGKFIFDISKVCNFLQTIWNSSESSVQKTLETMYFLSQDTKDCSPVLAAVVEALPLQLSHEMVPLLLKDKPADKGLTLVIGRMLDWLYWPKAINISSLVLAVLKGMASSKKFSLLMAIFEAKIEQLFCQLRLPATRQAVLPVAAYFLLSYTHSPALVKKVSRKVPCLISQLKKENSSASKQFLEGFCALMYTVMYLHPGFPDLYDPIREVMKDFEAPSLEKMHKLLTENQWGALGQKYVIGGEVDTINSYINCLRSETGKTGLVNLGNTCYMNSVLQALYMTERFCVQVLQAVPFPQETVLQKLQEVFAYLKLTQRPAVSPSDFLYVSKPPWFEPGNQQDCSEFLRFLLDQIEEQKKSIISDSTVTNSQVSCEVGDSDSKTNISKYRQSLVNKIFGGLITTCYTCMMCTQSSVHEDVFTDLHIAFPEEHCKAVQEQPVYRTRSVAKSPDVLLDEREGEQTLSLEHLVWNYFQTEMLQGDNQYHCDNCGQLSDAERTVLVTDPPEHLILSLLRFAYSTSTQSRRKFFTNVTCPQVLKLPSDKNTEVLYSLYAVVVHSGVSAESGHYYTYAHSSEIESETDRWYLFNDSHVSFSSYKSLSSLSKRFSRDTAYVLFYRKQPITETVQLHLKEELREMVAKDNANFLLEVESESKKQQQKILNDRTSNWKDDDAPPPTGGCGGGFGLGGMGDVVNRFVF
ncbi:deubiquitinating apoptotic inhibitor isoform X2 [Tachypleus tridentatus]|uniref:deubiquitinating apoptotic inhibitor isoform X2 n=2 Tax=Tachypleus tridentatus TaxID=6853 RepID=UPI003FD3ED0D